MQKEGQLVGSEREIDEFKYLKWENEPKSTWSAGKLFQRFIIAVSIRIVIIIMPLQAMLGWGETLRKWYSRGVNVDHQPDISNDYIGYYTDNGNITC